MVEQRIAPALSRNALCERVARLAHLRLGPFLLGRLLNSSSNPRVRLPHILRVRPPHHVVPIIRILRGRRPLNRASHNKPETPSARVGRGTGRGSGA